MKVLIWFFDFPSIHLLLVFVFFLLVPLHILHGKFKSDSFFRAYIFCMEILNLISFLVFPVM